MTPSTPPHFQLTRDERLQILALRLLNMKYEDIAKHLGVSIRQVQLACQAARLVTLPLLKGLVGC
jgi:DNA-directed RNA polymerase specialized sigma24 family protein